MTILPLIQKKAIRPTTLVELLIRRSNLQPDRVAFRFLENGEKKSSIRYYELDNQIRSVAAVLQSFILPGERALLLYPPGLQFIIAFYACLYAGIIAVPAYPPDSNRIDKTIPRLRSIISDAKACLILTTTPILALAEFLFDKAPDFETLQWLATDNCPLDNAYYWKECQLLNNQVAFIQYTAEETKSPRGVMVSHQNLMHNSRIISNAFEITTDQIGLSWLPPYHEMGLISGIVQPVFSGISSILMSPMTFLENPISWLKAISAYQANISGAPTFAYDLCIQKIPDEAKSELDLSSWSLAFIGTERIQYETIQNFCKSFSACGFNPQAFYPCYSLAESTLMVTAGKRNRGAKFIEINKEKFLNNTIETNIVNGNKKQLLVSSGNLLPEECIAIVNPNTQVISDTNYVGEIWIRGPSVASGYWNREIETQSCFEAYLENPKEGPYLRTGDLGFIKEDEIYITGRLIDRLSIKGLNYYPQDIERFINECLSKIQPGVSVVLSIEVNQLSKLVILIEIALTYERQDTLVINGYLEQVKEYIYKAISEEYNLDIFDLRFLKPGTIIRTPCGKIQRIACKEAYLQDDLDEWNQFRKSNHE